MKNAENGYEKIADAALIAAKAFDRLVTLVEKLAEREYPEKKPLADRI
jgi:hypothetical protein